MDSAVSNKSHFQHQSIIVDGTRPSLFLSLHLVALKIETSTGSKSNRTSIFKFHIYSVSGLIIPDFWHSLKIFGDVLLRII